VSAAIDRTSISALGASTPERHETDEVRAAAEEARLRGR